MNTKYFVSRRGAGGLVGWNELKTQSRAQSLVGTGWRGWSSGAAAVVVRSGCWWTGELCRKGGLMWTQ